MEKRISKNENDKLLDQINVYFKKQEISVFFQKAKCNHNSRMVYGNFLHMALSICNIENGGRFTLED